MTTPAFTLCGIHGAYLGELGPCPRCEAARKANALAAAGIRVIPK